MARFGLGLPRRALWVYFRDFVEDQGAGGKMIRLAGGEIAMASSALWTLRGLPRRVYPDEADASR